MAYSIDLERISCARYAEILKHQNLLPGRRVLLEDLDEKIAKIKDLGIQNLHQLKEDLATPNKLTAFSQKTGISSDYLTILRREMGSLEQKPVPLADFPGISPGILSRLSESGIKTSKDLLDHYWADSKFIEGFEGNAADSEGIARLLCLSDLVRINGVGFAAATTLLEAGYKRIADVAAAEPEELLDRVTRANSVGHYYSAKLGLKDMQFIIDFAALLLQNQ